MQPTQFSLRHQLRSKWVADSEFIDIRAVDWSLRLCRDFPDTARAGDGIVKYEMDTTCT